MLTKKCKCGCGIDICSLDKKGRPRFWSKGHNRRCRLTEEHKKKLSIAHRGKKLSLEHRAKLSLAFRGEYTPERREKLRLSKLGPNNPQWKGGATDRIKNMRNQAKYKEWRKLVFERDNYTCQECGATTGKKDKFRNFLNADHIKPISQFPCLAHELTNGRTLCVWCHRKTPTWGVNARYYNANI